MQAKSQRPKGRDGTISSLNIAIEGLNFAKEVSNITPAKAVFGSASVLLTMIKDTMVNKRDYVDLGLACADVCGALNRGVNGKQLDELSRSVCEAIEQLTMWVLPAVHIGNKTEKAIHHYETALAIASSDWHDEAFWVRYSLTEVFFNEGRFDDAYVRVEHAKSHTSNSTYNLGRAMGLQAKFWYQQHKLEEAKSEVLGAIDLFEKLGAAWDAEITRELLQQIEQAMKDASGTGW